MLRSHPRAIGALRTGALVAAFLALIGVPGAIPSAIAQTDGLNTGIVVMSEPTHPQLPITVRGADGRDVVIVDTSRIVSLSGNITEIIFGLGLGRQVVARDITATFPEARHLPVITRAHDVSAEAVLSLQPTLVLATVETGPPAALDQIRAVGVPVLKLAEARNVDDIVPRIRTVAAALGVTGAGEALAERTAASLAETRARVPSAGQPPRVAFLYMRGQAAVYMIGGPTSGADSMIRAAGGIDAGTAMGLDRAYTPLTSEAMVLAAPDVILMTTTGLDSVGGVDGLLAMPGIAQTPAGRNRRIITVEDGLLFSFGPRTPVALQLLVSQLYGDGPRAGG